MSLSDWDSRFKLEEALHTVGMAKTLTPSGGVGRNIPCERSSTCFSCRRRSLEGELLAEDGQVVETDQLPRATLRFYEQEP